MDSTRRQGLCSGSNVASLFNKKLAAAIRSHPCLYDNKVRDEDPETVWKELSVKFNEPIQNLQSRWRSLRCAFSRHVRAKILTEEANKSGGKNHQSRHIKPYYLLSDMKFLLPYMHPRLPQGLKGNFTEDMDNSDTTQSLNENDMDKWEIYIKDKSRVDDDGTSQDSNVPIDGETMMLDGLNGNSSAAESTSIKSSDLKIDPIDEYPNIYETTPDWHFFHCIMPDIMTMTPVQKRKMRMRILSVIENILDKE